MPPAVHDPRDNVAFSSLMLGLPRAHRQEQGVSTHSGSCSSTSTLRRRNRIGASVSPIRCSSR